MVNITTEREILRLFFSPKYYARFLNTSTFFLFWFIKEDAVAKFHIMKTYTSCNLVPSSAFEVSSDFARKYLGKISTPNLQANTEF